MVVDFNAKKTQLVSFDRSNDTVAVDVKMDGTVLQENPRFTGSFKTFSSKFDWDSYIIFIGKTALKKIGALIRFMKFISPDFVHGHAWNAVVMSGLVLLAATWNC